jgi:hypothetical protein
MVLKVPSHISKTQIIIVTIAIFILLITVVFLVGTRIISRFQASYEARETQQLAAPETAVKRQVRNVLLKRFKEDGTVEYYEILPNGTINVYDANMNLIKTGLQGYYKIDRLYKLIERNLDNLKSSGTGTIQLTITTNKGTIIIYVDEDEIDDIVDDIIEEIEDIVEDTFAPTPTPAPSVTGAPPPPSNSPTPLLSATPGPSPTPAPPTLTPTPTPLPDYMTAPPFTCEDYANLGHPVTISNIICGAD